MWRCSNRWKLTREHKTGRNEQRCDRMHVFLIVTVFEDSNTTSVRTALDQRSVMSLDSVGCFENAWLDTANDALLVRTLWIATLGSEWVTNVMDWGIIGH